MPTPETPACAVCGNATGNRTFEAREMMFGTAERFAYLECGACGSLQLLDVPTDLSPYYPENYYSLTAVAPPSAPKRLLKRLRDRYALTGRGLVGRWLYRLLPEVSMRSLAPLGLDQNAAILDVGCGQGHLLRALHALGFRHLLGIDPFNAADQRVAEGLSILKKSLAETTGRFDVVMLHHAFEHMDQPEQTLRDVARLLKPGGTALIRVPVADSFAYRRYGADWVNLDAPRHLFIYTRRGLETLALRAGLRLVRTASDSLPMQFWGSEQYRRNVPLMAPESRFQGKNGGLFSAKELREFDRQTAELNARDEGDQACFYFQRA